MLAVNTGKILGVFSHHFQNVVCSSCHQMAFKHIRDPRHCFLEGIQQLICLSLQGDLNKHGGGNIQLAGVQQGDVVFNVAVCLEPLHTAVAGRSRQVNLLTQVSV